MQPKLGIIAGGGKLPLSLARYCQDTDRDYCVVALRGHADEKFLSELPNVDWVRIGAAGQIIQRFKDQKVEDLVMVGPVDRPSIIAAVPDLRGLKFLMRAGRRAFGGDDSLLSAIANELEREGFRIVGIDGLLGNLVTPAGPLTKRKPDEAAERAIQVGLEAARKLGNEDIGQAVVVQATDVLALEDSEGTNELIKRAGALSDGGGDLILVKAKKPDQDRRVDLPAMGLDTVRLAAEQGFTGIAIEAGHSLFVDRNQAIEEAERANLFVVGV